MISLQQLQIRRSSNMLNHGQAYLYALGGESWAKGILYRDQENNKTDSKKDDWAIPLPPIPVEGGQVSGHITDLQGRFNLNNLVLAGTADEKRAAQEQLERLLIALELEAQLRTAIQDWVDSDIEPLFPGGAEDDQYLSKLPAYRAANRVMASVSELRAIQGMDAETYTKLRPHVTALPVYTPININDATTEVIMALADGFDHDAAQQLADEANNEPYETVQEFLQHDNLAGLAVSEQAISVNSNYFLLYVDARTGSNRLQLLSLLKRDSNGKVTAIYRSRGKD